MYSGRRLVVGGAEGVRIRYGDSQRGYEIRYFAPWLD